MLNTNKQIQEQIEVLKKIKTLLQDEKVREFANCIGYTEKGFPEYVKLEDTLYDFLKNIMSFDIWSEKALKEDQYPIYCFLQSEKPIYTASDKKMSDFKDLYWNLQKAGYSFGPSDSKENGKNRERFRMKNIDNIIYPPEGESFMNSQTFYKVQAEYVEETLRTNQREAKTLIIQKYGKQNKTREI